MGRKCISGKEEAFLAVGYLTDLGICDAASFSYRRSDKGAQCCLGFGVNGAYFYVARLLPSWHIHESPGKKSVGTVVNHTFQKQKIDIGVIYFSQWDYEMSGPGVPNDGIG